MAHTVAIHGTYPFDSKQWIRVRSLSLTEASELSGVDQHQVYCHPCKGSGSVSTGACPTCNGEGTYASEYLWLNKGFRLIDVEAPQGSTNFLAIACAERFVDSPSVRGIEPGALAVYLHDGTYCLIRRI